MSASQQLTAFNYAVPPFGNLKIKNITAAYRVSPSDNNFIINCTANTFTVALPPAASLPVGFNVTIWNTSGVSSDLVTIDPNGTEYVDGLATLILSRGEGTQIVCDGTNWQTGNKKTMRGYAESISAAGATRPVASGISSIAIGVQNTSSSTYSVSLGAFGTASGAESFSTGRSTASANYSTAIGENSAQGGSQAVTGAGAMALGGSYASGTDSFAAAVANNTSTYGATGANSIAMGSQCLASASKSTSIGGENGTASGAFSVTLGGSVNTASGESSYAFGVRAVAREIGKYAYGATTDYQGGMIVLRRATTDATASVMVSNTNAASTFNQLILANNSAFAFTGIVVARRQAAGGTASAAWKVEGLIRREANAGTTTLVASTVTAISNVPGWTLALSADTTNGGLAITATGAAATNIRWVATIQTSECTYA